MYKVRGDSVEFTWDERKHRRNKRKHGVSFQEAAPAFDDPYALRTASYYWV